MAYAAVGAAVNVVTSYIAAKVTGQSYALSDGLVAAASGAACAFGPAGAVIAGLISGGYSAYASYASGSSLTGSLLTGIASGVLTGAGIGNIVGLNQTISNLGLQALLDFIFCTGYNSMSAAIYKSVTLDQSNNHQNTSVKDSKPIANIHSTISGSASYGISNMGTKSQYALK